MVLHATSLPTPLNGTGRPRPPQPSPPKPTPAPAAPPPAPAQDKRKRSAPGFLSLKLQRMLPQLFNRIRILLLIVVVIWTIIVLAIAVNFLNVLESSDLTSYVPLAIFAAAATFFVIVGLIVSGCLRRPHPISHTRYELIWLGVLGCIWLALGAYTSSAPDTELVCWSDDGDLVDDLNGFNNDVYHARYRVLQGFSLFTAILLLGFFLLLLILAIRRHRLGRPAWHRPVTTVNWFDLSARPAKRLPPPVTARVTMTTRLPADMKQNEKPKVEVKEIKVAPQPPSKPPAKTQDTRAQTTRPSATRPAAAPAAQPATRPAATTTRPSAQDTRPGAPRRTATVPSRPTVTAPQPAATRGAPPRRTATVGGHQYVVYIPPHGSREQPRVEYTNGSNNANTTTRGQQATRPPGRRTGQ